MNKKEFNSFLKEALERNRQFGYLGSNTTSPDYIKTNPVIMNTVNEVMKEYAVIHTSLLDDAKPKTGPKPKEVTNPYYDLFQDLDYEDLTSIADDVLTGAARQCSGNTVLNEKFLFHFLRTMDTFSTKRIREHMNSKRILTGEKLVDVRYAQSVFAAIRNAIDALNYQKEKGMPLIHTSLLEIFSIRLDSGGWEKEKLLLDENNCYPQTQEEKIDKMKRAGLTDKEINRYYGYEVIKEIKNEYEHG